MFYVTLSNLGYCTPNNGDPTSCTEQTGWGLSNTADFSHVHFDLYWSGTELSASNAWLFIFDGARDEFVKNCGMFAWAVRSGDVSAAAVPAPAMVWLLGIGLVGAVPRRR